MSNARFSIVQSRAVRDERISDSQFRTLSALGMYADKDGWCFPKLDTIGKDLGKSKQAVGRDTIALRKLGYLQVESRHDTKTGMRQSSRYRLIFDFEPVNTTLTSQSTDPPKCLSTSEVDGINVKELNDLREAPTARPLDLVDGILEYQKPAQTIRQAIHEYFRLNVNWDTKTSRQWMEWAVGEKITPEQIREAADKWRSDKLFNWSSPTLTKIFEQWPALMGKSMVDDIDPALHVQWQVENPYVEGE